MAQFSVNQNRIDPYKNFKFRVRWDGKVVAGVSKVSALKRSTEVVSHRQGNDLNTTHHSPASTKSDPITLERGMTHATEFRDWAAKVYSSEGDGGVSLAGLRKDITIEMLNLQGTVVRSYNILRCWVSEYTALPELDANGNAIAFETIVLQNEGWIEDPAVTEVAEF